MARPGSAGRAPPSVAGPDGGRRTAAPTHHRRFAAHSGPRPATDPAAAACCRDAHRRQRATSSGRRGLHRRCGRGRRAIGAGGRWRDGRGGRDGCGARRRDQDAAVHRSAVMPSAAPRRAAHSVAPWRGHREADASRTGRSGATRRRPAAARPSAVCVRVRVRVCECASACACASRPMHTQRQCAHCAAAVLQHFGRARRRRIAAPTAVRPAPAPPHDARARAAGRWRCWCRDAAVAGRAAQPDRPPGQPAARPPPPSIFTRALCLAPRHSVPADPHASHPGTGRRQRGARRVTCTAHTHCALRVMLSPRPPASLRLLQLLLPLLRARAAPPAPPLPRLHLLRRWYSAASHRLQAPQRAPTASWQQQQQQQQQRRRFVRPVAGMAAASAAAGAAAAQGESKECAFDYSVGDMMIQAEDGSAVPVRVRRRRWRSAPRPDRGARRAPGPAQFRSLYAQQRTIVVFVRHFL